MHETPPEGAWRDALARGDMARAALLAERALAAGESAIALYQLAAIRREAVGDWAGAHQMLARALSLAPGNATILTEIAAVWRRSGDPAQALTMLDAMIGQGLDQAATWLERAHALKARNAQRDARHSYENAVRLAPDLVPALAGVADMAARMGATADARAAAERALQLDPADLVAANVMAAIEIETGEPHKAYARLEALLGVVPEPEPGLIETLTHMGDAAHALGRHDRAFVHYADAQTRYRRLAAPLFGDERRGQHAWIRHVHDQLVRIDPAAWGALRNDTVPGAADRHIFLMGYPRSGTTMIENVLATAPDVVALEEKPTMIATEPLLASERGILDLGKMDQASADGLRLAYWQAVAGHGVDVVGRTFVDMNPIRGVSLPLIARLFPDARIVIMRRDPRDVVWSCFRRYFSVTPTGYAFSDLDSIARHYDALMALMEDGLARLPLHAHIVRYEELVADFDGVTGQLCDFVGVGQIPAMRDFGRTALQRGVTTASVRQVRRGLFDGTGQWHPYRDHLAPILPILQPWIDRFGYAP